MSTPYPHPTGAHPTVPQPAAAAAPEATGYPTASPERARGGRSRPGSPSRGATKTAFHTPTPHRGIPLETGDGAGTLSYALYCVFALSAPLPRDEEERERIVGESLDYVLASGAQVRGWYDVGAFRADSDLMVWLLDEDPRVLQDAYHRLRASAIGRFLAPVWTCMGAQVPSEFHYGHTPACFGGVSARDWATVYPLVRDREWYLIDNSERSRLMAECGRRGFSGHPDVKESVLSAFALSDYEYVVAYEADTLDRLEGVMHAQRYTDARSFVREDTPFFTGPRVTLAQWEQRQPRS